MMLCEPMLPATMSPELMPMPMSSRGRPNDAHSAFSTSSARTIASAVCTACSA
jgi:hypothetical protein